MLAIRADLHGIEETITRNILITVVSDIKALLGMKKDIYTVFDEKDTVVKKKNALGEVKGQNTFKEDMFNIDFEETTEDGHELSLMPLRPDFKPIYFDQDVESSIIPITIQRKMEIRVKYSNKSKSKIFAVANKLKLMTADDSMYKEHELEYHYTIPTFVTKLIAHINNLRNIRMDGENKLTLDQYIDKTFDDRVDFTNTLDGDINKTELVIREAQTQIEGYITDELHSIKPEYDENLNTYYMEFSYCLSYEKVVSLLVKYPIMVYNTLIDKNFRTFLKEPKRKPKTLGTLTRSIQQDLTKTDNVFNIRDNNYYVTIPEYDNEVLPRPLGYTSRMFSVLTQVDEFDRTLLFNINDIPKIKFRKGVLDFIMFSERKYVGEELSSLIHIELFQNNKKAYKNNIILEEDGTLRSSQELDFKYVYRVVFNIVTDVSYLNNSAKERFKKFVQKQLVENSGTRESVTFQQSYSYWSGVDFNKFNQEIKTDNLITDYLTMLEIGPEHVNRALIGSNRVYDIPFKITEQFSTSGAMSVMIARNLPAFMEEK